MARTKGMLNLSGNLEVNAGAPLDARTVVPTLADLTIASNFQYKYVGMPVVVQATGDMYVLTANDVTDIANWKPVGKTYTAGTNVNISDQNVISATDTTYTAGTGIDITNGVISATGGGIGVGGGYAPIGTIISYMGTTAPQDYLACDGTVYNIADYKQLADFFTAQFGSVNKFGGNGTTTFAVPDLRGEFLRGTGTNSHTNQGNGANVGTHQDATAIPKLYTNIGGTEANIIANSTVQTEQANIDKDYTLGSTTLKWAHMSATPNNTGNTKDLFTTRPTNTSILYCIKAVCAGEVYSTTERVVGTWIDGKPIYQKILSLSSGIATGEVSTVLDDTEALNIDMLVDTKGWAVLYDPNDYVVGKVVLCAGSYVNTNYSYDASIRMTSTNTKAVLQTRVTNSHTLKNVKLLLQYTKTS